MEYDFQKQLVSVWEKAVKLYSEGNRDSSSFPIEEDLPFLASIGMNKMDVFDFAEDWVCEGEPDLATFLMIHEQRKDYFWEFQNKVPSSNMLNPSDLPAKTEEVEGIVWLPRIIPKARAKLRGELLQVQCFAAVEIETFSNQLHSSSRVPPNCKEGRRQ